MNRYPDNRYNDEREMYEHFKSLDYSKQIDWKILFSDFNSYMRALKEMAHPFHKEAMQIRQNRINAGLVGFTKVRSDEQQDHIDRVERQYEESLNPLD